jgi:hypothetical protein
MSDLPPSTEPTPGGEPDDAALAGDADGLPVRDNVEAIEIQ